MKIARIGAPGQEIPVLIDGQTTYDLSTLTSEVGASFWAAGGFEAAREALRDGALSELTPNPPIRFGPPIGRPMAVLCIGQNYAAHAAESGDPAPQVPILFHKHPNTVVGPFDEVYIPRGATKVDWEIELGVVIGRRARYLNSLEEALECVGGYVTSNDVSERDFQTTHSGGQWSKGKNAETFNPVGPYLVDATEIDPQNLRLYSRVNGEIRQDSSTADMIFPVAEIIHHLSQHMVLEPGDLINTGTPQGVALSGRFPYLSSGDVMELGIEGLGEMRQTLRPAP